MRPVFLSRLTGPFALIAGWLATTLPPALLGVARLSADSAPPGSRPRRLWLDLPADRVLLRDLSLPAGQAAQWRDHTAERLPLLSPWTSGAYLWDAAIRNRDGAGGITVVIAMAAAADIAAIESRLGRSLAAIRLAGAGDRPPLWLRQDRGLIGRIQTGLAVLVLGTCLLGLGIAALQTRQTLADQQTAAADLATAARLRAAADHPAGLAEAALALLDQRPPEQSRALTLARLAARLPEATWAVSLRIDAAGFELSGLSPQPEALVPLLEADPGLEQVQLSASSTREAESGLFTFTISGRAAPTGDWP